MIQSIGQPNSKLEQAGATRPVTSGLVGLPSGIALLERACQETKLQTIAMPLFSVMLPGTRLGYIDHNLIQRRSSTVSGAHKV